MAGAVLTMVTLAAVLLVAFGSPVSEVTMRILVISPPAVGITTTVKLVLPPLDSVPTLQTTLPPKRIQPGEAETNVTLAGKMSVRVTLEAVCGPRLKTVRV